jgi:hypothetical protein
VQALNAVQNGREFFVKLQKSAALTKAE